MLLHYFIARIRDTINRNDVIYGSHTIPELFTRGVPISMTNSIISSDPQVSSPGNDIRVLMIEFIVRDERDEFIFFVWLPTIGETRLTVARLIKQSSCRMPAELD